MNQVVTELTIDGRGAEVGSALYVRSMHAAQAAVDRLRERELALQTSQDQTAATMLTASTSVTRAASAYDRLKASIDPLFAASKGLERDLLTLDRAVTRLGVSEAEAARMMDMVVLKHDAAAAAAKRQTDEYLRLAAAGRQAQDADRAQAGYNSVLGVRAPSSGSARLSAGAFVDADREAEAYQRRLIAVRGEIDPLTVAIERMNTELAEMAVMLQRGDISAQQFASGQRLAQQRVQEVQTHLNNQGRSRATGGNLMASINAGQQMQDIIITSMMGQSIGTIALQQGSQMGSAAMMSGAEGGRFGLLNTLKSAATDLVNPVMLGAVAFTAVTAAAIKFFASSSDGAKQLTDLMKEHNAALKQVEDGYKAVDLVARGTGRQSQLVSGFQSQQSIDALRRGFNRDAAFGTLDTQLLVGREQAFGLLGGNQGEVQYLVQAEDAALGLGDAIRQLMVGIESGYPDVLKFNDQLAAMGQAPGASKALKDRIAEILEFTKVIGDAQAAIRAYDQNFGPDGKLRGASPFNRQDMKNYDRWRIENEAAIRNQGRQFDAEVGAIGARSPAELAAAARAREEATFNMDESAGLRRARIANAETLARRQAEYELDQAQQTRARERERGIEQQQTENNLIGKSVGEIARVRYETEQLAALREEAAQNHVTASEKEIQTIRETAEAVGFLAQEQEKLKLLDDIRFERSQLALTASEQAIASRLRGTGQGLDSEVARELRTNQALERQVELWNDIRQSGMDAYNDIFDLAFDGFEDWEDVARDMFKGWAKDIGRMGWWNPMLNEQYEGANLPTLDMTGGIGGFFKTMLGMTANPAAQAVGAMNVSAATVVVNGANFGGAVGDIFNRLSDPNFKETSPSAFSEIMGLAKSKADDIIRMPLGEIGKGNPLAFVGNYKQGVDAQLTDILKEAALRTPGYDVKAMSGFRAGDPRFHGKGLATDVQLWKDGRLLDNYQNASTFRDYEKFAQTARQVQMEKYPELADKFRWGGYFSGAKGKYGANDPMHFDLGGDRVGMGGGSWQNGLTDAQRRLWPGIESYGMGQRQDAASKALERFTAQTVESGQNLGNLGTGFKNLANAFPAAPAQPTGGGGGGLGGLFSSLFGGFTSWEMSYFNNPVNVGLWHSGRYPGGPRNYVSDDPAAYASAMRYHNGRYPLGPNEERAIINRDEVIFRDWAQAKQVTGGGSTRVENNFYNSPPVVKQEETDDGEGGKRINVWFEEQVASAATRRGSAANRALGGMGVSKRTKVR